MTARFDFVPTPLAGAFLIRWKPRTDERGLFARAFCAKEFASHGLCGQFVQANISINRVAGTVRGMHRQLAPHGEVKLVRCTQGALFDVVVDIRPDSPTYLRWFGAEISEGNGSMMYVPEGFAHGYQSLTPEATALYLVSAEYAPHAEAGLRHDDPVLGISWPIPVTSVSPRDTQWPLLRSP
jgi:dTDP-4-dehydrorhamnose 3,5-epimerase